MTNNIEDYKERTDLTDLELDILYLYLDTEYQNMKDEERAMWAEILDKIDPDNEI
jgi:succinate dehydrogenase flavin-adding protein (antitoxin of CptAB toxin-antitoxin module)